MPKIFHRSTIILLLSILCLEVSCGKQDNAEQDKSLRNERDSLLALVNTNQHDLELMTSFFDEVAACIDSITEQEALLNIQINAETNRRYRPHEIVRRLNQLSEIILGQRQRIASLVDSLNNRVDTLRTSGLRNTIAFLTKQLASKEEQIRSLRIEINGKQRNINTLEERVNKLTADVGNLTTRNTALTESVKSQSKIINEGYILVGDKQMLKEMGVIEGGGLLRKSKVNLSKISISQCNKVDITSFMELPIHARKIKLLSPAPTSSFSILHNGDMTTLHITDANSFWSLSNILVVQIQ